MEEHHPNLKSLPLHFEALNCETEGKEIYELLSITVRC